MQRGRLLWLSVGILGSVLGLGACRETDPPVGPDELDLATAAGDLGADDLARRDGAIADLRMAADLASAIPNPAPMPITDSYCLNRFRSKPEATGIQVVVRVDEYKGVKVGGNGPHEFVHGTVVRTPWVFESGTVDTANVEISMNVQTPDDKHGLPMEIPVAAGEYVEVQGEYIAAAKASARTAKGPAAVIHFTHDPCGYAVLGGTKYP
jgi:hypothetical protein